MTAGAKPGSVARMFWANAAPRLATFAEAVKKHKRVADAFVRDSATGRDVAETVWNAVTGRDVPAGTYAQAVAETLPPQFAGMLAVDEVAAAYAFDKLYGGFDELVRAIPSTMDRRAALSPTALRNAARKGWATFAARAEQVEEIQRGFGWDQSESWNAAADVAQSRKLDLASVARIARMAGRMYAAMRGGRAKRVVGLPEEVYDVELGSSIPRLLPSELSQIDDPDFETAALARVVERRALQYAVRGTSKTSGGPLVLALDESGSMHAQRREWSKAAAVALMRVAADEKRPVSVVHFAYSVRVRRVDPKNAQDVLEVVRSFLDGGTYVAGAINNAANEVEALSRAGKRGADVVIMTDGIDPYVDEMSAALANLQKTGARLWTVAIDTEIPRGNPLRDQSAQYTHVSDDNLNVASGAALAGAALGR